MKNQDFQVKTYTGLRLWWARRKARKHAGRLSRNAERALRPVVVLGDIYPEPEQERAARSQRLPIQSALPVT